jgi:hypothetical protein
MLILLKRGHRSSSTTHRFGPIAERHRPPTQSPLRFEAAILSRTRSPARDECTLGAVAQNLRKLVKLIDFSPPGLSAACA